MDERMPMMDGPPDAHVRIDGERYLYFGGTSYLGLHAREEPIEAGCRALRTFGLHTATTRTGFGNSEPVITLEREAAGYFETEAAVCLPSGYLTATAMLKTIASRFDVLLIDGGSHYAVTDAARMTDLPARYFPTCDPTALDRELAELSTQTRPLLLTDGLFPMGKIAPLEAYRQRLSPFVGAAMLIDDAHGFGTLGEHGWGTVEHLALADAVNQDDPPADRPALYVGGTLSKALGGYGGLIAGEAAFIDRLRRHSQIFAGASALPSGVAAASAEALRIARDEPELRKQLHRNVKHLRSGLAELGVEVDAASPAPIVTIELQAAEAMREIHDALRRQGIIVPYIPVYSGLGSAGALRVAVFATHTTEMIDRLLGELRKVREVGGWRAAIAR